MTWTEFCNLSEHDKALIRERARVLEDLSATSVNFMHEWERLDDIREQLKETK